jgi:hypothetical protein
MFLDRFHSSADELVRISAEQGSRFAKEIADDFNPIHNPDAKRFCVPGDLLFSLVLASSGLSRRMSFGFTGMVGAGVGLHYPDTDAPAFEIRDTAGRVYLKVEREGECSRDEALIEHFTRAYVAFSGHTFPHVLVPLMRRHGVMISPERPLVIYEGMSFDLERLEFRDVALELADSTLEVSGKRGDVRLRFVIRCGGEAIGTGAKTLVLSGLRAYDDEQMRALVDQYTSRKEAYFGGGVGREA